MHANLVEHAAAAPRRCCGNFRSYRHLQRLAPPSIFPFPSVQVFAAATLRMLRQLRTTIPRELGETPRRCPLARAPIDFPARNFCDLIVTLNS